MIDEAPKNFLTLEDITKADDRPTKDVYVEEWGGWVKMRVIDGSQRDRYITLLTRRMTGTEGARKLSNYDNVEVSLLSQTLIKENGEQLFTAKQLDLFRTKNGKVINRLYKIAEKFNGLEPNEVKDNAKNSDTTTTSEDSQN